MSALLIILFSTIPHDTVIVDSVDLVEVNNFYDDNGKQVFQQVIWYEWNNYRYEVIDWRLVKDKNIIPCKDFAKDCHISLWFDNDLLRKVEAKNFRETWTQFDPELVEREFLCKERRKLLNAFR